MERLSAPAGVVQAVTSMLTGVKLPLWKTEGNIKMVDVVRILVGAVQVEIGFAMLFIDGPLPLVDVVGGAVMWRGRQNILEGWRDSPAPAAKPSPLNPCVYFDPVSGVEMYA